MSHFFAAAATIVAFFIWLYNQHHDHHGNQTFDWQHKKQKKEKGEKIV